MALTNELVGLNPKINSSNTLHDTKSLSMKQLQMIWRCWAKALGQKASECDKEADNVAIVRTTILVTYLVTNAFIVAGVARHWNEKPITIEIYENPNRSENIYSEKWHNMGMGRNTRVESISCSNSIKSCIREFE